MWLIEGGGKGEQRREFIYTYFQEKLEISETCTSVTLKMAKPYEME